MRVLRYIVAVLCASVLSCITVAALEVAPPSPLLPQSPLIISAYSISQDGTPRYFEIYNDSSIPQKISDWQIAVQWTAKPTALHGVTPPLGMTLGDREDLYIPPEGYAVLSFNGAVMGASLQVSGLAVSTDNYVNKIGLMHSGSKYRPYERSFAQNVVQAPMRLTQGTSGYNTTYAAENRTDNFPWQTPWHLVSPSIDLRVVEVYPNPGECQLFDTATLCGDYVKIYNPSREVIDLSQLRLRSGLPTQNAASSNSIVLSGGLLPGTYAVVPLNLTNSGSSVWLEDKYGLAQYQSSAVTYPDGSNQKGKSWAYDNTTDRWRWSSYPTPYNEPNRFTDGTPINTCSALRLSEIGANLSEQFIEIYNASNEPVNILGCQLQTNRSRETSFVFGDQVLGAGEFVSINLVQTKLALTKTTSGTVYILSSDGLTEVDARSYENLSENSTFALVDGVWQQTFVPTPGAYNIYEPYLPCQAGYERNLETGRCNKITSASVPVPCDIDEYRSSETGRCRKLSGATASTLTACKEGQYRSPETNRCRSLATAASSELKPCAAGQERNPETNRCRKVSQGDGIAGFKVVDTPTSSDQMLSWLAIGGVGLASIGYAGWEWRREVWGGISKIINLLPFVK
jgi:hypothetical protein